MVMMETMKWIMGGTNTGDAAMYSKLILVAFTVYLEVAIILPNPHRLMILPPQHRT